MSSNFNKLASELKNLMSESDARKPKAYDTQAEVLRVEKDIVWVHIPGGVDETPVRKTIDAKKGDKVRVHIAKGSAYLVGNATNPPTDDMMAKEAIENVNNLKVFTDDYIQASAAKFEYLEADTAYIRDLKADNITTDDLKANTAYIKDLTAEHITADDIVSDHAAIGSLDTDYAKINAANIDAAAIQDAWINKLLVQTGLIAHEGTVFELDAIQVNASKIKTGTLDVERLIVSVPDPQDPTKIHKYMVHVDPSTGQPSYEKVDADILEDLTITADKIVAETITVDKITAQNLQGTSGWINLHEGKFFYGDGANFASATNAIAWNGSKLQIKADEFLLSSGKSIFDELEAIETWFYAVPPTTSNEPAVNWNTEKLKEMHLRDIYFDTTSGKSYRWALTSATGATPKVYSWVEIEDVQYNALAGRVSTNETNITQNKNQIVLKANASDVYKKNEVYTKTETKSEISQTASEIDLSVTQKISNIQIGSKNILRGTEEMKTGSNTSWYAGQFYKSGSGGTITWNYDISDSPVPELKKGIKVSITTANTKIGPAQGRLPIKQGPLTLSAWVKGEAGDAVSLQPIWSPSAGGSPEETGIAKEFTITDNKWHKYEYTYTARYNHSPDKADNQGGANGGYVYVKSLTVGREILITGMKLEAGNKATDWTPAPEDLEAYADNAISEAKSEIKVTTDGISTEVSKKVGNSEVISKINQSAEAVKIQASKVAITDSTNYVQLNDYTYNTLDWLREADSSNPNEPWYYRSSSATSKGKLYRDMSVSEWFDCQGGESFRVGIAISSNIKGPKTSGGTTAEYLNCGMLIQAQNSAGTNTWRIWNPYTSSAAATEAYYTSVITLPSDAVRFRVRAHIDGYNDGVGMTGTFKVRKFTCFKMANANLIVDGAVTADKLAANSLTIGKMDSTLQSRVGKTITTATDLNTLRTTGIYYLKISGNTNCPTTGHGKLEVNFDVGTPYQIWQPDSSTPAYYKRYYSNSTWSAWTTVDAVAAGKTATSYITDIDSKNGVIIKAVNGATSGSDTTKQNYVKLNASGLDIYQGGNSVAKYGATSRIGLSDKQRVEVTDSGVSIYSSNNTAQVVIGNDRISLGKSSNTASISLCNDKFEMGGYVNDFNTLDFDIWMDNASSNSAISLRLFENTSKEYSGVTTMSLQRNDGLRVTNTEFGRARIIAAQYDAGAATNTAEVWLGIGSGGNNHGVYSETTSDWLFAYKLDSSGSGFAVIPLAGKRTGTAGNPCYVTSAGFLMRNTSSSRRYKQDIKSLESEELNPEKLYSVDVKQFVYRDDYLDKSDQRHGKEIPGFIVEDLDEIYPIAVTYENEQPENWDARYLIPPMLKLIQDQKKQLDELQAKIERSA